MKTFTKILGIVMVLALVLGFMPARTASAATDIVYDAIPDPLAPNYPSLGFQATSTSEFGDYIHLAGTNRLLKTVTVTMSTWAYQATYPAMTDPTGWDHPITLNIYNGEPGDPNTLGSLIATKTQVFHIPWRPAADPTCATPTAWRAGNGTCYNGYAFNITFNLSSLNVTLPDDIIVGIAYNTNTWGYNPIGLPGPYESLNVGAIAGPASPGTDDNADRVFWNTAHAPFYEDDGASGVGTFREDTNWTGNGTLPIEITADAQVVVPVYVLGPSWTTPGGEGVYAAYYGPLYYDPVSPGSTALFDGREAGIIKAGIAPDPVDGNYWDEGILAFKVDSVAIADFAAQALMFDVQNESGTNPVWVRIRLVGGTTYQFVPTTNPAGWHTVDAAAGEWQLMDNNGNATGPKMSLSTLATSIPSALVDRVYLTLGMGNSYNVSPGVGTVGWVDKVTIGSTTYDFLVEDTCTTDCYVSTTGSDSNAGNEFSPFLTIQKGINTVSVGGTVHVAAGTYSESLGGWRDIEIKKSLSLIGAGSGSTIVEFTGLQHGMEVLPDSTGAVTIKGFTFTKHGSNPYSAGWGIIVGETGGTFNSFTMQDVDLGYSSARNLHFTAAGTYKNVSILDSNIHDSGVYGASFQGTTVGLTVANSHFDYNGKDDYNHAYGLAFEGNVSNISVTNSTFEHNYAQGINATGISNAVFDGISASFNGDSNPAPNNRESGFNLWDDNIGSHDILIKNSTFANNGRSGLVIGDDGFLLSNIEVTSSTFDGNVSFGIISWTTPGHLTNLTIHHNRFASNPTDLGGNPDYWVNATNNWWGCNAGPGSCSGNWGNFATNPWLVMKVSAIPALAPSVPSTFTADLTFNNANADTSAAGYLPASTVVGFAPTTYIVPVSNTLTSGKAASLFTPPVAAESFNVCANLDVETVCLPYSNPAPLVVYVDLDWAALTDGAAVTPVYPAGAPAAVLGYNAFDNLHDALAAVSAGSSSVPGKVYVDAGNYTGTGAILIDKNWVTVRLNTGVVIQNASPCFTVAADYVTIKAESLAGAKCVPTDGANGINVIGARRNLTLEKFEIDGTDGLNGIYFDDVMTDLVIADLFIHNNPQNGILFAKQPVALTPGAIDIHGNMFRDNGGNGIEAGAFLVPAEFNSWGDLEGAAVGTGGDGISGGVDADPWTHIDVLMVSSTTPWDNQVVKTNTIVYTIKANLMNVNAADFDLYYPENLTFVSATPSTTFDAPVVTHTPASRKINFQAYKYVGNLQPTTNPVDLFTVTFTAATTVKDAVLNLDDTTDGFGMGTTGSSSNVYGYELVDGSVTVIDLPTLSSTDLAGPYVAGLSQEFHVTLDNPETGGVFTNVLVDFKIAGAVLADIYSFEYFDGAAWHTLPLTQVGADLVGYYGPSAGFPMSAPYNATSLFRIIVATPGSYEVTVNLMDLTTSPDFLLATLTQTAVVNAGNFTVIGTFSMQGRTTRLGIPVTLTIFSGVPTYGPYSGFTIDQVSNNLTLTPVNGGTYKITTNQARYLNLSNVDAEPAHNPTDKTILVDSNKTMNALELKGGNAQWADNYIDILDAGIIGSGYKTLGIEYDGDVNFDDFVDIRDLAIVGANWHKSSADFYNSWIPWTLIP